jgi:hypothetical protein
MDGWTSIRGRRGEEDVCWRGDNLRAGRKELAVTLTMERGGVGSMKKTPGKDGWKSTRIGREKRTFADEVTNLHQEGAR